MLLGNLCIYLLFLQSNLQTLVRKIDLRLEDFSLGQHLQKELHILLPQTVVTEKKSLLYHLWVIRPSCQYTNQLIFKFND
ncbi:putative cyclic nucleotide-gated ion channel [Trichinella pseudospiralis]